MTNIDPKVVEDFGREWRQFDQTKLTTEEIRESFNVYFAIFPWESLPENARGFDLGCGSGRWAKLVAPRVAQLHCIDPSGEALDVAKRSLSGLRNCHFHLASVDGIPLDDDSMDFGYSLGVLHHVPDTAKGIQDCVAKLKPGAPFLVYLYYAFDNRPLWFVAIWKVSDLTRRVVSRFPYPFKYIVSQIVAAAIYFPLARLAPILERLGVHVSNMPLSVYRNHSFYTMRTDALDRFGTRLEHRFTKKQIEEMLSSAGLRDISFSETPPYWCAIGYKALAEKVL